LIRYQRRIKLLPALHLNLTKSGVGLSAGRRGFHVGLDARKRPYVSAGIPGTGLSWREELTPAQRPSTRPRASGGVGCLVLVAIALGVLAALLGRR
jgi:hypothetical protein